MSSRLAIARDGQNVLTESDKDLLFSTGFNNLKIWKAKKVTITVPNGGFGVGSVTQSYSHGLSYAPTFSVYYKILSGPNAGKIIPFMAQGPNDFSTAYTTSSNIVFDLVDFEAGNQEFYYLINVDPVSTGTLSGALNSQFRIAKDGFNCLTEDNEVNYEFLSNRPVYNIYQKSTATITLSASNLEETVTIAHNLGYIPLAIVQEINEGPRLPYLQGNLTLDYFLDSTNIYIRAIQFFTTFTIPFSFKIQIFTNEYGEDIN